MSQVKLEKHSTIQVTRHSPASTEMTNRQDDKKIHRVRDNLATGKMGPWDLNKSSLRYLKKNKHQIISSQVGS